jgi:hypothetical protein
MSGRADPRFLQMGHSLPLTFPPIPFLTLNGMLGAKVQGGAGMIWLGAKGDWRKQHPRMLRIISDDSLTMGLNPYAFELLGITIASDIGIYPKSRGDGVRLQRGSNPHQ